MGTITSRAHDGRPLTTCGFLVRAEADGSGSMSREELRDGIRKISRGAGAASDPGALERAFDAWLRDAFVPAAFKAMAKKKMTPAGA